MIEDYILFAKYCQTGRHPALKAEEKRRNPFKQRNITEYFTLQTKMGISNGHARMGILKKSHRKKHTRIPWRVGFLY